ncbi:Serine/threonine-protein kinase PknB [Folsomia candida]|uniref:Serine/threonine-protein kinase PknB n=1 Tax=Folsomia candida TaxID=158441 RepID=A0A226DWX8_FOLCA|nr:Serine/threonine-protein kinase PknB [Folsomia candida]
MELCGKTLRHWLNINNDVDSPELHLIRKRIVIDMCDGLKYIHNNKIMHRDFRPENIMFSFSSIGQEFAFPVKVGDFGLCRKVHSEDTITNTLTALVGSVTYSAPETSYTDYSIPADLYSFGLVSWEVLQQIRQKDMRSMFHRLVHDAETDLIQSSDWWFRNWAYNIINLTKRRVQDRIQGHGDIFLIDSRQSEVTVESHEEFSFIKGQLVAGDIININIMEDIVKSYHFVEDNLTFNGVNALSHQNVRIVIGGNHCTINNLTLEFLGIKGNNNVVSNVICDNVNIMGNGNQLTNVKYLHPDNDQIFYGDSYGVYINGGNHILQNVHCGNIHAKLMEKHMQNIDPEICDMKAFVQRYGPICIYLSKFSESCAIKNANLRNSFVDGNSHALKDIRCNNVIQINGKYHKTENLAVVNLIGNWRKT